MAAPSEMVTLICVPSTATVDFATSFLIFSDAFASASLVMPGRTAKNSSPPQRPTMSDARKQLERVLATVSSARSPAACPYVSLTLLNASKSASMIPKGAPDLKC